MAWWRLVEWFRKVPATEGDSPVRENQSQPTGIPSRTEHVKLCLNLGGPPSKAKYSSVTDSELVP